MLATKENYDFVGFATVHNIKCGDGRIIEESAFAHQNNTVVPLVWRHQHDSINNILGNVLLIHEKDHVKGYGKFNDTVEGRRGKELVQHKDVQYLSIWANELVEHGYNVKHGSIKEVSLVIAGMNPGAMITDVVMHSSDPYSDPVFIPENVFITTGEEIVINDPKPEEVVIHEKDSTDKTVGDVLATLNESQKEFVSVALALIMGDNTPQKPNGNEGSKNGPTILEFFKTLTDEQQLAVESVLKEAADNNSVTHSNLGENQMTYNVFQDGQKTEGATLSHEDMRVILADAVRSKENSLKEVILAHAGTYGIDNIEVLFPDAKYVDGAKPSFIVEPQGWVSKVIGSAKKSPFSRIKSSYANITADEARAKGYITGSEKFDEVFPVFSRVTTPQTIYKKQSLDRDDIIDITEFDVVMWLKEEMRLKLEEELARAILFSDGRSVLDPDKIKVANVRPIYGDDAVYVTTVIFGAGDSTLDIVDKITVSRKDYKGSGAPTLFCSVDFVSDMMIVRDTTGRRIYETEASLAAALRVSSIVEVPFMDSITRVDGLDTYQLKGIIVNMRDYVIGADKGGQLSFFEDFDIDFNKHKYLYETRVSGALVLPKAAIVLEELVV